MTTRSLITSEMRKAIGTWKLPQFDPQIAGTFAISRYYQALEDTDPLWSDQEYAEKTRWGGIIAPPTFVESFSPLSRSGREGAKNSGLELPFPYNFGAGVDFEFFMPLRVGDLISSRNIMGDISEKSSASGARMVFFRNDSEYRNQKGQLLARNSDGTLCIEKRTHREATPGPAAVERQIPQVSRRQEQVYFEDVQIGDHIPSYVRTFDVPALVRWQHAMGLWAPMQYDYHHAIVDRGLPDLIVQGSFTAACFGRLITDWIGGWGVFKKLSTQFRGTLTIRQQIHFAGQVSQKYVKDGENFVELQLWTESHNGQKLHLGKATVALPTRTDVPRQA